MLTPYIQFTQANIYFAGLEGQRGRFNPKRENVNLTCDHLAYIQIYSLITYLLREVNNK